MTLFGQNIEFFNWNIQMAHINVSKILWYRWLSQSPTNSADHPPKN